MQVVLLDLVFLLLLWRNNYAVGQKLYPTAVGGVGAVYTMTNGAMMNQILIQRMNANGQLTMVGSVNTNGTGVNTTNADPLFSQGVLTIYSNYLFAVNPGSNSLSMFWISPSDATQLTLLSVYSTFGWFPVSVTANSMYACVLTGGNITGIRCFTYNTSGLYIVSSFDRNLTSYLSQSVPPSGLQTMSEILFSGDNLALIVSIKGMNTTTPGYLLFYLLSNSYTILSPNASVMTPTNAARPFSMTLVGSNGLLITDPGSNGVLTLNYTSTNGTIYNSMFTPISTAIANGLCWSTYSPTIGNYYVIGAATANIVELSLNLSSNSNPVQIIQSYSTPNNSGALETTVVTLAGNDYLYVLGTTMQVINGYQLNAAGNATMNTMVVVQTGDTTNIPKLAGIAAFVQTRSSSAKSFVTPMMNIVISMVFIFFNIEQNI